MFCCLLSPHVYTQPNDTWYNLVGSAYIDNASYEMLGRLCDEAGGRLMGSAANDRALEIMMEELQSLEIPARYEEFTAPGWTRGNDIVRVESPFKRTLRAAALGYVEGSEVQATMFYAAGGHRPVYDSLSTTIHGKIALVTQERIQGEDQLLRYEVIDIAAEYGAAAVLFINDKSGGQVLCGVSNFEGRPSRIPAYSITYEEGKWLQRLLERGTEVAMTISTESKCSEVVSSNIISTLPGRSGKKIVIGAHFDSWDVGHGGVDNGQGTAILFDVARLLTRFSPNNRHTLEFVWFNGEELGLWGSRKYVEAHRQDPILAMINMDMTGTPRGFNAMGFNELIPMLERIHASLKGYNLDRGVTSNPWTNSDHMYFMFEGIPTLTLHAHLEKSMYQHYHDFGDTFDKVDKKYLSDAAAVISVLGYELANQPERAFPRYTQEQIKTLLIEHNLEDRLRRQGEWKFGD